MKKSVLALTTALVSTVGFATITIAGSGGDAVTKETIEVQRATLAEETSGKGFGPQSPRDIDAREGNNNRAFSTSPPANMMTLCDIHFHENAEHKGGEFTTYAGDGDGFGNGTGFKYSGTLSDAEMAPVGHVIGKSIHGDLEPGDTIEIHFVFSTAQATLGNSLGTCLSDVVNNPQLRVETVVAVLVNDGGADFSNMAKIEDVGGLNQVPNLPADLGTPVVYNGSTTGPGYNEMGSPFKVTWSVRPDVVKLDINTIETWLEHNPFGEHHAHGVRNLVINPDLLSPIN